MPARGSTNRQHVGQTLKAAFGTPPTKEIQITKKIVSPRGTSQSTPPTIKTKGYPKGKSVLYICCKLFSMLLDSNVLQ